MNYKNAITMTTLSALTISAIVLFSISTSDVFAVSVPDYKVADDTYAKVKFTFRTGIEETYFPVFKMTSSYVGNEAATFQLQGSVADYPYLNEAMDQAYDFRLAPAETQYDYKQFVVDVDFVKNGIPQKSIRYVDCRVSSSTVDTVLDNAEGYVTTKTGFAIINVIDFTCSGLSTVNNVQKQELKQSSQHKVQDYGKNSQKLAEDVHSYVTFFFNDGIEKIDFPVFKMNTGFSETSKDRPSFTAQGIVASHTLLDNAISKSKNVNGIQTRSNYPFNVNVDFANDSKTFRTLVYSDCRIEEYKIDTLFDKEEGYTGKSGYAIIDETTVTCAGLTTKNYSDVKTAQKNIFSLNPYKMGGSTYAFVTITMDNGAQEKLNFPVFKQTSTSSNVNKISRLNPSFQLQGVVGDYPVLYKAVDQIRTRSNSGTDTQGMFSATVDIVHNDKSVKVFQYSKCRVTTYDTDTSFNAEEGYMGSNGFALVSTYDIECNGYHPSNPSFEKMIAGDKAKTESSSDLKKTNTWRPGFFIQK
ncbi:MAG: hypothetical protein ACE5R5_04420 [Nitrosarchaeum sp.]